MIRFYCFIFIVLWSATVLADDGISVSQSISTDSVAYEDSVSFEIVIQWTGTQADYRFEQALRLQFDKLRPGAYLTSVASKGGGESEITTKSFRYTLIPNVPGMGLIEPVIINFVTWPDSIPGQLITEPMTVQIARPTAVPRSEDGVKWWPWLIAGAVFLGAVIGYFLLRRNKKEVQPVEKPVDRFKRQLTDLRIESGSDWKKFQSGLVDLLVAFFQDGLGVSVSGLDEIELTRSLSESGLSGNHAEALAAAYCLAERDKFRPVSAGPGEVVRCESGLQQLVNEI